MPGQELVAGFEVKINGAPVDVSNILEVRVEDNLMLPDACMIKIADHKMEAVDANAYQIGGQIEIGLGGTTDSSVTTLFKGEIASLEPVFSPGEVTLTIRGFDHSHKLNRAKKTETYTDVTYADVAKKVAGQNGLATGTIASPPGGSQKFVQQSAETDWEFLWRLANRVDFEVVVADKKLNFRKAGGARTSRNLKYGDTLLSFRPRVTGVQQVEKVIVRGWDPAAKKAIVGQATVSSTDSSIGISRGDVSRNSGGGTMTVSEAQVMTASEANALAESIASRLAHGFLEAEGSCYGDPQLGAGSLVTIEKVGTRFSGKYSVTQTTHVLRGSDGYQTHFRITGRAPRSLIDLLTPAKGNGKGGGKGFGGGVVIGVVTNNDDPDKMGRVRVKYPSLGDNIEGWWARIASPSAGKQRGLLMMPIVGEEVLVAFEQGDTRRPYVIGSLWNGKDAPGDDLVQKDGSFVLASDKFVNVTAKENISIKGSKDFTLETQQKTSLKAQQDVSVEGQTTIKVKAGTTLSIEGTSQLEVKCGNAKISMTPASLDVQCGGAKVSLTAAGTVSVSGTMIALG